MIDPKIIRHCIASELGEAEFPKGVCLDVIDSLELISLKLALESTFGVSIPSHQVTALSTFDDLVKAVQNA